MLNRQALHTLLHLELSAPAPVVIIYSPQLTERLDYTCGFIFGHVLKVNYQLTSSLEEFEHSPHFKINYSAREMLQPVQIIPHSLLFEKGTSSTIPPPVITEGKFRLFASPPVSDPRTLDFDLFSAVFYFISRYEEWQDFERDQHGRFEAKASLLFRQGLHLKPLVDEWIMELAELLQRNYAELQWPPLGFRVISTLDVDNLFAYRCKGLVRSLGAGLKDLMKADLYSFRERLKVLSGKASDPFDIYDEVSEFCASQQIPLFYFFLFRSGTRYDRTVSPTSGAFKKVLARVKHKKAWAGLHPSYDSSVNPALLQKEVRDFSAELQEPVILSRQHYLRFDIRSTPNQLLSNGILADFTMGFASSPGFRAGTSRPFFYYDFLAEKKTGLLFVPFCVMDGAYTVYGQTGADEAYRSMLQLAQEVKKTKGLFISVFHERTFFHHLYPGFNPLYKKLHLRLKDL
jgi:hypothetical protein